MEVDLMKRLRKLGFKKYSDYLHCPHWFDLRKTYRESGRKFSCAVCDSVSIQLHHCTYERLGRELLDDLLPLCKPHHDAVHGWLFEMNMGVSKTNRAVEFLRAGGEVNMGPLLAHRARCSLKKHRKSVLAPSPEMLEKLPMPRCADAYWYIKKVRLLIAYCAYLQGVNAGTSFGIGSLTAAKIMGVSRQNASRRMKELCRKKILIQYSRGSHTSHLVSEYRFEGDI